MEISRRRAIRETDALFGDPDHLGVEGAVRSRRREESKQGLERTPSGLEQQPTCHRRSVGNLLSVGRLIQKAALRLNRVVIGTDLCKNEAAPAPSGGRRVLFIPVEIELIARCYLPRDARAPVPMQVVKDC